MALKLSVFDKKSALSARNKYKNMLVSALSPSPRKADKTKKTKPSATSKQEAETSSIGTKCQSPQTSTDFPDPDYAAIQDMQEKDTQEPLQSLPSSHCETPPVLNQDLDNDQFSIGPETVCEPVYATVSKKTHKTITIMPEDSLIEQSSNDQQVKLSYSKDLSRNVAETDKLKVSQNISQQEQSSKEKIQILQSRLKDVVEENKNLRKHLQVVMKERKWKEDSIHAKFHLKLTELEAETNKDVKSLKERIHCLAKENELLVDQVQTLYQEKKTLQNNFDAVCKKTNTMVTVEEQRKAVEDQKRILEEVKMKNQKEREKLLEEYDKLNESNNSFRIQIQELHEKVKLLETKNERLKLSGEELLQEKVRITLQLEDSKKMESEAHDLVQSLLKAAEGMVTERDVLLNKASFQDQLQKQIQATIVGYSLNIGRLQEHITTLNQEKLEELQKIKTVEPLHLENMKKSYEQQLDLLHSKILNQNNIIRELECDKRKLESQLESIWQAICVDRSKFMDQVNDSDFLNT